MKELTPQVRKKVVVHHRTPCLSTEPLKGLIVREGGFGQKSYIRTAHTESHGNTPTVSPQCKRQGKVGKGHHKVNFKGKKSIVVIYFICLQRGHIAKDCHYAQMHTPVSETAGSKQALVSFLIYFKVKTITRMTAWC